MSVLTEVNRTNNYEDRNHTIDIVKCVAVIMVILGHCIQYSGVGNEVRCWDIIYKIIYSFHMPLFSILAGYLLVTSVKKRKIVQFYVSRIKILLPMSLFSVIPYFTNGVIQNNETLMLNLRHFIGFVLIGNGQIWYLQAYLAASFILGSILYLKNNQVVLSISVLALFGLPSQYQLALMSYVYFFMVVGAVLAQIGHINIKRIYFVPIVILYVIAIIYYKNGYMIYNGIWGIGNADNLQEVGRYLFIDIYRIFIGCLGCALCNGICSFIDYNRIKRIICNVIKVISQNSLNIYCSSNLILVYCSIWWGDWSTTSRFVGMILTTLFISGMIALSTTKSKIMRFLLLGRI